MPKLSEAYIEIRGDDSHLNTSLNKAEGSLSKFMGKWGKTAIVTLAGAAGAYELGSALGDAVKKAADLGESLDKVKNAFGAGAGGQIIKQADELAKKYGIVRQEALDAASAFGLMGRAANLSKDQSAKLGSEFVSLGIDLASFHNLTNQEAFEKLRSGLAGESEPLRPLGILLSEDAVKAEALASGLIKVKRELTDQEKVLARVALIRKQMATQGAIGDRERTAGSVANQMKKMAGEVENFKTEFGRELLPALTESIKLAHELGAEFEKTFNAGLIHSFGEGVQSVLGGIRLMRIGSDPGHVRGETLQQAADRQAGISGGLGAATPQEIAAVAAKGAAGAAAKAQIDQGRAMAKAFPGMAGLLARNIRDAERDAKVRAGLENNATQKSMIGTVAAEIARKQLGPIAGLAGLFPSRGIAGAFGAAGLKMTEVNQDRALRAAMEEAERKDRMKSEFTTGEDFWRQMQLGSLNGGNDAKTNVEKLQENTKKLEETKEVIKTWIDALKDMIPRMRGRA